jgi:hypothetical protein
MTFTVVYMHLALFEYKYLRENSTVFSFTDLPIFMVDLSGKRSYTVLSARNYFGQETTKRPSRAPIVWRPEEQRNRRFNSRTASGLSRAFVYLVL